MKTEFLRNNTQKNQPIPHRKHIMSPLQRPTGYCFLGKEALFTVRIIRNTQKHCGVRMQSFVVLKWVVYMVTTELRDFFIYLFIFFFFL
jgi:hypothetical protein